MEKEEEITLEKAAKIVGMSTKTITRWCKSGKLKYKKVGFKEEYRIKKSDLTALAVNNGYDIFEEEMK